MEFHILKLSTGNHPCVCKPIIVRESSTDSPGNWNWMGTVTHLVRVSSCTSVQSGTRSRGVTSWDQTARYRGGRPHLVLREGEEALWTSLRLIHSKPQSGDGRNTESQELTSY